MVLWFRVVLWFRMVLWFRDPCVLVVILASFPIIDLVDFSFKVPHFAVRNSGVQISQNLTNCFVVLVVVLMVVLWFLLALMV